MFLLAAAMVTAAVQTLALRGEGLVARGDYDGAAIVADAAEKSGGDDARARVRERMDARRL
jgi:hypothetical protein